MNSVVVEILDQWVRKYSTDLSGYQRLSRELKVLKCLSGSVHTPTVVQSRDDTAKISIDMEAIQGQSLRELLDMQTDYVTTAMPWNEAKQWLAQYIDAEMDLLSRDALYRDMNLDHLIFAGNRAVLIDMESTIISADQGKWLLNDMRGTWETMAPEEFIGYGELSARTATYRVAVIAHIILTGKLPFKRFSDSRSATYHWRMMHMAEIDRGLSHKTRRVFASALARKPIHRYKNPERFLDKLTASYR